MGTLYRPVREMNWPLTMLLTTIASSMGTRISPELVALLPITPCTNTGRKKMAPNMVMATPMPAMFENAKILLLNRCSGRTGSGARLSTQTNAARSTSAAE